MIVVLMGVSGSGKTTVGRRLAERLGWAFLDGDSLHSAEAVAKMASGVPLEEADREPWLERLARWLRGTAARGEDLVVACSALRRSHRERLSAAAGPAFLLVHLRVSPDVLRERLKRRSGHFMPASLLESQLEALEPPVNAMELDATLPVDALVEQLSVAALAARER